MDSIQKNNKIKDLEEKIKANKIQMAIDQEKIEVLQTDIHNLNGGFQVAQKSIINIMQNFNEMFPSYSVEIK